MITRFQKHSELQAITSIAFGIFLFFSVGFFFVGLLIYNLNWFIRITLFIQIN